MTNYTVSNIYNGLTDHDAQLLIVKYVNLQLFEHHIYTIGNIHKYSVEDFKSRLSYKSWNSTIGNNGVDYSFNTFLNNYLKIFYTSFAF
jgi:hypothetical protein